MSDYEKLKEWIMNSGYEIKTDLENLINMCFGHYDGFLEDEDEEMLSWFNKVSYFEGFIEFIKMSSISEYDYYC